MNTEPDLATDKPRLRYQLCCLLVRELWARFRFCSHLYKMGIITIANKSDWVSNTMLSVAHPSCHLVLTASLRTGQLRCPFDKEGCETQRGQRQLLWRINEGKCFAQCLATAMAVFVVLIIDPFVKTVQYPRPIVYSFLGTHPWVLSSLSFLCHIHHSTSVLSLWNFP